MLDLHLLQCSWWRHQIEVVSALLALLGAGTSTTGGFPAQMACNTRFDVFLDVSLKQTVDLQVVWDACDVNVMCMRHRIETGRVYIQIYMQGGWWGINIYEMQILN